MKTIWLGVIVFSTCCLLLDGCKKTYHIPENMIVGGWCIGSVGSVMHDGHDVTPNYSNMCISFTRTTFDGPFLYNASSATPIFNQSGTAQWMGATLKQITIDAGKLIIDIEQINDKKLIIVFTLTENYVIEHNGDSSLAGEYSIELESVKL